MECNKNINMEVKPSNQAKGYLMVLMAGILWGSIGLFVKLLYGIGATTGLAAFMRLFMASLILTPILFIMGGRKMFIIDKKGLIYCLILGVFTQALFNYLYNLSIGAVGVASASVLLYTSPVFVSMLSYFLFKELINKQKILALILNIFGCVLMVSGGDLNKFKISLLGIIFGLASAFLYSLIAIIGKVASDDYHPFSIVFYSFLFGWVTLLPIVKPWEAVSVIWSAKFWLYALGFGLIPTVGSYLFYMSGLRENLELSKVPVIASIETVVATILGIFIFKEAVGLINILGIIVLILSIALMNYNNKNIKEQ